jgi:hypothetical protein
MSFFLFSSSLYVIFLIFIVLSVFLLLLRDLRIDEKKNLRNLMLENFTKIVVTSKFWFNVGH